ncbi:MAG: SUMF1/EgtB/PvdO family nonheme iron enzyme [Chthoniobacterales bacterium]|nr:SUMF1/EgtB/PvdO family nonheme iron enzyme [Chthoniobacterales bacterium]
MLPRPLFLFLFIFCNSNFLLVYSAPTALENHSRFLNTQEYTLLLNAVATKSDPHHLYSYKMEEDSLINRQGRPGHYFYQPLRFNVIMGDLTYFSALRFCNWMENECPKGKQSVLTTERGSYDLSGLTNEVDNPGLVISPKQGANWLLASNNPIAIPLERTLPADTTIDTSLACSSIGFCIKTPQTSSSSPSSTAYENGLLSKLASVDEGSINNTISSYGQQKKESPLLGTSPLVAPPLSTTLSTEKKEDLSIKIELVTIDSPYNHSDTMPVRLSDRNGDLNFHYGSVDHAYQIGTYDVTVGQYRNFLMAVARTGDPYHLFHPAMQTNPNVRSIFRTTNTIIENGITTTNYTYTVIQGMENYPITCVSYWSAIRFCNWLANQQPQDIGECNPRTTEDGSYDITNLIPRLRQESATWRLPTQDEWYKAAYKVPSNKKEYWVYSTGNQQPHNSAKPEDNQPNSPYKNANYCLDEKYTANISPWITPVGVFSNSPGPWSTYDMGGNAAQITDDSWVLLKDPTSNTEGTWNLIARGGSWRSRDSSMVSAKSGYQYIDPSDANEGASETVGFRVVCATPPPPPEKHTLYKTLRFMFDEDLENAREGNDQNLVNVTGYFSGALVGFGVSASAQYAITKTIPTIRALLFGAEITAEAAAPEAGLAFALTPPGIALLACLGFAAYVYHTSVNDQTPYEVNGMMKRAGVGCVAYAVGAVAWIAGKVILTLL